jgi:type I restriction enzyme S subunit
MTTIQDQRDREPDRIPPGWSRTTLGALGDYWNGRGFKRSEWRKTGRQIIRIQDLTGTGASPNYFQGEAEDRHVVRRGDLLVSWAATLGVYVWDGPEAVLNQHIFKVESSIDKAYHRWLIESVLDALRRESHGTGMIHITRGRFDRTPVAVPPLDVQGVIAQRIDEAVSRMDNATRAMARAVSRINTYTAAVLAAAFDGGFLFDTTAARTGDAPRGTALPAGWSWRTVDELSETIDYGTSAKADDDPSGIPVLRMGNLRSGMLSTNDLKYLPHSHPEFPRLLLAPGDVLFNRTNSAQLVGQAAVYAGAPSPCSFASYLIRVRLRPGYLPQLLPYFLLSPYGRAWARSVTSQQVGQANINGSKLRALKVPVPPLGEQQPLVDAIEMRLEAARRLRRTVSELRLRLNAARAGTIRQLLVETPRTGALSS